jgi:hypothetical protein
VRAADGIGRARLLDGGLEGDVHAVLVELGDDLLGAVDAPLLRLVAGRLDPVQVDPIAADVEILGVLVHAGHLDGGNALDPELGGCCHRFGNAGDAVVVGEGHDGHSGLSGGANDIGRLQLAVGHG